MENEKEEPHSSSCFTSLPVHASLPLSSGPGQDIAGAGVPRPARRRYSPSTQFCCSLSHTQNKPNFLPAA